MQDHRADAFASVPRPAPSAGRPLASELAFVSPEAQVQRTAELLGEGAIVAVVPSPPASMRGKLAEYLDDRIERALGVRGAPSPYLAAWTSSMSDGGTEARLADQLERARGVGATGLAIALGSLERIAAPALTPEDSATLRGYARAARDAAVVLLVDDGDVRLGGYGEAVPLAVMLAGVCEGVGKADAEADAGAEAEAEADADAEAGAGADADGDAEADADEVGERSVDLAVAVAVAVAVAEPAVEVVETHVDAPVAEKSSELAAAQRRATVGVPVAGPSDVWRSWAIALGAARGPQPLAAFERLFVESYMPLANAIAQGLDDPRALRAHDEFSSGFERAYTDAFATFGASSRRPRLVMDAYEVASRQARLHNARTTHVLVVDAMRHDLGCAVRDQIAERAQGGASLTSESLLWSALPTTTFRQLETLARGMDALRAPATEEGNDSLRGRSAETVRRLRVGSRELYKLDVVPSMLSALPDPAAGTGPAHVVAALGDIAVSVADALLRHIETLPPRTLLLVLGDHGFTIDRRGHITHGGATPEEVLVPCLAYLVGDLH